MANLNDENALHKELLTVKEAADYLRVSRVTTWRWCQQGVLPAFRIGRSWRIRRETLLRLEENCGSDHRSPEQKRQPGSDFSETALESKLLAGNGSNET